MDDLLSKLAQSGWTNLDRPLPDEAVDILQYSLSESEITDGASGIPLSHILEIRRNNVSGHLLKKDAKGMQTRIVSRKKSGMTEALILQTLTGNANEPVHVKCQGGFSSGSLPAEFLARFEKTFEQSNDRTSFISITKLSGFTLDIPPPIPILITTHSLIEVQK